MKKVARCFLSIAMPLDQNEKKLIEKLASVLKLINSGKKIDSVFFLKAGKIFDKTEPAVFGDTHSTLGEIQQMMKLC